jgi:hypothetical protein
MKRLRVPAALAVSVLTTASCNDDDPPCVIRCVPALSDAAVADPDAGVNSCDVPPGPTDECPPGCMIQFDHCFT